MRSEVAFEDSWDDTEDVIRGVRRHTGDCCPLLETISPLRAAWAFLSRYLIERLSGNIKNGLLFAIFQRVGMLSLNMGKVTLSELEGLALAESADIADAVALHLVTKPFIDIAEVRGIAIGKCANVRAQVGENMSLPHSLVLELLHSKAERAFHFFLGSCSQLVELRNSHSG